MSKALVYVSFICLGLIFVAPVFVSFNQPEQIVAQVTEPKSDPFINISGSKRRVIGDTPTRIGEGRYRVRLPWFERSLAVYLNGKRCQRRVDYTVNFRDREIIFTAEVDPLSSVIVDYEPR